MDVNWDFYLCARTRRRGKMRSCALRELESKLREICDKEESRNKKPENEMKFQISKLANLAQCSAAVSSSSLEWSNCSTIRIPPEQPHITPRDFKRVSFNRMEWKTISSFSHIIRAVACVCRCARERCINEMKEKIIQFFIWIKCLQ